jgi:steroid delta-isomerase-like uncharacterized protein
MGTEWVENYLDAWNSHDGKQVAAFMSDDVTYEDLAGGATYRGHAGIVGYVTQNDVWSRDYRFVVVTAQADGARYAIEWEMLGTNTGVLAGIPPTGKPYRIRGASVGRLDAGGRIAENRDYANLADYLAQVGLFTPPS